MEESHITNNDQIIINNHDGSTIIRAGDASGAYQQNVHNREDVDLDDNDLDHDGSSCLMSDHGNRREDQE